MEATLGVLQRFVADGRDGWEFALHEPDAFLERAHELGAVTGRMHSVLASDATDPDFAPEEPGDEALGLLIATIDEEIERTFLDLREDDAAVAADPRPRRRSCASACSCSPSRARAGG